MKPIELFDLFRTDVDDAAKPYLWADTEVWLYLNDAQRMFCRLTGGIEDATSRITQVPVQNGNIWISYDPRIMKIRYANRVSDGREILVENIEGFSRAQAPDDYGLRRTPKLDSRSGPLEAVISGMSEHRLRCVPVPNADDTLALVVNRLPLYTLDERSECFEIDEQHHEPLLMWMRHRAYGKHDADAFDRTASDSNKKDFVAYCEGLATHEKEMRKAKPRVVVYGGI